MESKTFTPTSAKSEPHYARAVALNAMADNFDIMNLRRYVPVTIDGKTVTADFLYLKA